MKTEKLLVREAFARAASCYDAVADFQRDAGERLLAECATIPAPNIVLDAGCGTGHGLRLTARRWPAARTIALDFAEAMLRQLPPRDSQSGVCGDIESLPLAGASIDLVWSSLAMQWCDTARAAHEFARVLREGGYLAIATLGPGTFAELRRAFAGVDEFRHTNDFTEQETLRQALLALGLTPVVTRRVEMVRYGADLPTLLASVRELGANHVAAKNRRPGLMGKTAWRRFADNYESLRTPQGLPLTYDTYFIIAKK